MYTGLIFTAALSVLFLLAWRFVVRQTASRLQVIEDPETPMHVPEPAPVTTSKETGIGWWQELSQPDKLHLAWSLAVKCLPLWERCVAAGDACYRNTTTGPLMRISTALLINPVNLIGSHLNDAVPFPHEAAVTYADAFIEPMIAMHDGNWAATYPVKKHFLAVYNMLKALLGEGPEPGDHELLTVSISQSIDCLDMCRLYSRMEIDALLESYKKQIYK